MIFCTFIITHHQLISQISVKKKKWLIEDGYSLTTINLILNNLGKKVQINIKDKEQYYENEVIINNNYIYFDSLEKFKY